MKTFHQFLEEARRMRVLRTAHYTSRENRNNILRGGFKSSPSTGAYHPDDTKNTVYTTPSSRVGSDYGGSRVSLKIMNPKVTKTLSPAQYRQKLGDLANQGVEGEQFRDKAKEISPVQHSRRSIASGSKVVIVPDAHRDGRQTDHHTPKGDYIMVDKDLANRSIDRNPAPIIPAKNKPRRRVPKIKSKQ